MVELAGRQVLVVHDRNEMGVLPTGRPIAAVISGHSHRPEIEWKDGILYLNPGAAGPRRFRLPVTLALMHVGSDQLSAEIVHLPI